MNHSVNFPQFFETAITLIKAIEEPEERINQKIRLIEPVRRFEKDQADSAFFPYSADFIREILGEIAEISSSAERDYLYRLAISEIVHDSVPVWEEIDSLLAKIENNEEEQAALFTCAMAAARLPEEKQRALDYAEQLDDLGSYEKVLRIILTAADGLPEEALVEKMESPEGIFRLWGEIWGRSTAQNDPLAGQAQKICTAVWDSLDDSIDDSADSGLLRDRLLAFLLRFEVIPVQPLRPFISGKRHPAAVLEPLGRYAVNRKNLFPPQWEEEAAVLTEFTAEKVRLADGFDPESRIRANLGAAEIFYTANQKNEARNAVRRILDSLDRIENQTQQAAVLLQVESILSRFGEKKTAEKIASRLMQTLEEIEPEDLRFHQMRDLFRHWIERGAFTTAAQYEDRLPDTAAAMVRAASMLLGTDDFSAEEVQSVLLPVTQAGEPEERAACYVKICRLTSGCALEL